MSSDCCTFVRRNAWLQGIEPAFAVFARNAVTVIFSGLKMVGQDGYGDFRLGGMLPQRAQ
jgi:hypothetical protein